jgi:hypothetical protein
LIAYADRHFACKPDKYVPEWAFEDYDQVPEAILRWMETEFTKRSPERPKTLVIVSESRYGKSDFARTLGNFSFLRGRWSIAEVDESSDYIVFDDINWDSMLDDYKQWFGAQDIFVVTDKYNKKRTIRWGKPMICLCNPSRNPLNSNRLDKNWLKANSVEVILDKPLSSNL